MTEVLPHYATRKSHSESIAAVRAVAETTTPLSHYPLKRLTVRPFELPGLVC